MSLKKWNEIFGYSLFIIGALKIILLVLIFMRIGTNLVNINNGGDYSFTPYNSFSIAIGYAQIILAIGSIVMIVLNMSKQPEVITGYLLGLGAVLLELIVPPFLSIYTFFIECGMYMRAGTKIRNKSIVQDFSNRTSKQTIKNTEWFYGNDNK